MTEPQIYYVPAAPPALGLPRRHLYRDCPRIRKAVVREAQAGKQLAEALPLCKVCEGRRQLEGGIDRAAMREVPDDASRGRAKALRMRQTE